MAGSLDSFALGEVTERELKEDFASHVTEIRSARSFATFGTIEFFPLPGIFVEGVGTVGLPLLEESAHALVRKAQVAFSSKCTSAPHIDELTPKTWEITASDIKILNEKWRVFIDQMIRRIACELGVESEPEKIRAEFHNMLIQEEGSTYNAHNEFVSSSNQNFWTNRLKCR